MNWQLIETAPKVCGEKFIGYEKSNYTEDYYIEVLEVFGNPDTLEIMYVNSDCMIYEPTHWMPLPPPPKDEA